LDGRPARLVCLLDPQDVTGLDSRPSLLEVRLARLMDASRGFVCLVAAGLRQLMFQKERQPTSVGIEILMVTPYG
jgi:hypothetical protein